MTRGTKRFPLRVSQGVYFFVHREEQVSLPFFFRHSVGWTAYVHSTSVLLFCCIGYVPLNVPVIYIYIPLGIKRDKKKRINHLSMNRLPPCR